MSEPITTSKPPAMKWPEMPLPEGCGGDLFYKWHRAINDHSDAERKAGKEWPRWMYDAKKAACEVPRLALLFQREREKKLQTSFRLCACCSEGKHITDNDLTCCLGVKCRECPHLAALDTVGMTPEETDWIKAWTCSGHILASGGDVQNEGFVLTVDDRMFWDRVCRSMADGDPEL